MATPDEKRCPACGGEMFFVNAVSATEGWRCDGVEGCTLQGVTLTDVAHEYITALVQAAPDIKPRCCRKAGGRGAPRCAKEVGHEPPCHYEEAP